MERCACLSCVIGSFILYLACLWCFSALFGSNLKEIMYNSASYIAMLLVVVMYLKPSPYTCIVVWNILSPSLGKLLPSLPPKNTNNKINLGVF